MNMIQHTPPWGVAVFFAGSLFILWNMLSGVMGANDRGDAEPDPLQAGAWYARGCATYFGWMVVAAVWLWFWTFSKPG